MRRRGHQGRRDATHTAIREHYRAMGCPVIDLGDVGDGCGDLLVLIGQTLSLVEVKTARGKLEPRQVEMARIWPIRVIRSTPEAEAHIAEVRGKINGARR